MATELSKVRTDRHRRSGRRRQDLGRRRARLRRRRQLPPRTRRRRDARSSTPSPKRRAGAARSRARSSRSRGTSARSTVVDTPGQGNFVLDAAFALRGVGAMLLVLDPTAPIRAETLKVWGWAKKENLPVIAFVNRLDRPDVNVERLSRDGGRRRSRRGRCSCSFRSAVAETLRRRGRRAHREGPPLPGRHAESFKPATRRPRSRTKPRALKASVTESAAESDDELIEKYLEAGELGDDDVRRGLRAGVAGGKLLPVLLGSAAKQHRLSSAARRHRRAPARAGRARERDRARRARQGSRDRTGRRRRRAAAFVFKTIIDPHAGQLSVLRVLAGHARARRPSSSIRARARRSASAIC